MGNETNAENASKTEKSDWILGKLRKTPIIGSAGRLPIRLRKRLIDAPLCFITNIAGSAMALGALTSDKQGLGNYLESGLKGIYNIPQNIINTFKGAEIIARGTNEIIEASQAKQTDLDLMETHWNNDSLDLIDKAGAILKDHKKVQTSNKQLLDTIQEQEEQVREYAIERAHELENLVENAVVNMQDPIALSVTAGFVGVGLLGSLALLRYGHKIPGLKKLTGPEQTELSEDLIYFGKMSCAKISNTLATIGIGYSLGKESSFSKAKEIRASLNQKFSDLSESSSQLYDTMGNFISEKATPVVDGVKSILSYFNLIDKQEALKDTTKEITQKTTLEDIELAINRVVENTGNLETQISKIPSILEKQTEKQAYIDFLNRVPEGLEQAYQGLFHTLNNYSPDTLGTLMDGVVDGSINIATNAYENPGATAGLIATLYLGPKALLLGGSLVANTLNDKRLKTKQKSVEEQAEQNQVE